MNYRMIKYTLGWLALFEAAFFTLPMITAICYGEWTSLLAFLGSAAICLLLGGLCVLKKPEKTTIYAREGFVIVSFSWILLSILGCIPFLLTKSTTNFIDALFETASGFTTTGASIFPAVEDLSHAILMWRSFTHWIGGMGVLVFVLIFIPESNDGSSMHLLRAESPGPQVGKIVSKMKVTTRILYLIYLGLTVLEIAILMLDAPIAGYENEKFFFSLLTAFGTAGTGGFGFLPGSMEMLHPFSQYVVAIFLIFFGCNFALYYLISMPGGMFTSATLSRPRNPLWAS